MFDTGVRPIIDNFLLEEAKKKRDYGDYWSASSAGYCMRKLIFERLGVPPITEDARKQRVFTAGHIFHSWIQELTRKAGVSVSQEEELQDEDLMVRGHYDDIIDVGNKLVLYDYKTQNSMAFTWAKKQNKGMSHYHKMQLGTYMYMLRNTDYPELKEARILKISKDDLRMSEEQLMWSDILEEEVTGYWRKLNQYWKDKKLPPCTCADHEGGFMAKEKYNPFFYNGGPCSIDYYQRWKRETVQS